MSPVIVSKDVRHCVVYREEHSYCAHPHMVVAQDGSWVVVFNLAPRRPVTMHPPEDPLYQNLIIRSVDEGRNWAAAVPVPGFNWAGTECAGLTLLSDGRLMLNQWRFNWWPLSAARRLKDQSGLEYPSSFLKTWAQSAEHDAGAVPPESFESIAPWVRGTGQTFIHFSDDNGASFGDTAIVDTTPFSGGYGMRGGVEMPGARLILPFSDVPHYRQIFTVESRDGGGSWLPPRVVAAGTGHEFEEPALLRCRSGKLLMILRDNGTRHLHQTTSEDDGTNWSSPRRLAIEGYPAHLLQLGDGRILMTYGWRQPDFGIRAVLSQDEGDTWATEETICIRSAMKNKNLGYPTTISRRDDGFFTVYYGEDSDGITTIQGTYWRL